MQGRLSSILILVAVLVSAEGVTGQFFSNATPGSGISVPINGFWSFRGAAWADFTGDGNIDLFAPETGTNGIKLWTNNGLGQFTSSTVLGPNSAGFRRDHYCIAADIDNDGDEDVFLCQGNSGGPLGLEPNQLWINDGFGNFTEEAATRGVGLTANSFSATFGDYDRDGWIDLYVGIYDDVTTPTPFAGNVLYRNTGNGTFVDVTSAAGASSPGHAFAVLFADQDGDQWPDLWVVNDLGTATGAPTALLRNNRNGTFTDVAAALNCDSAPDGMGITVGDIHNDGGWDTFIPNLPVGHVLHEWNSTTNTYNMPTASYYQVASNYGLQTAGLGWGCQFFDYNNDGDLDLFVMHSNQTNRLFEGSSSTSFTDVTAVRGITSATVPGFSSSIVDYDNDGNLDIYVPGALTNPQLARNPGFPGNSITLVLQGTNSNRSAIGAVVKCTSASGTRKRQVTSGEGFMCQSDKRVHFGLGSDGIVTRLEIRWPSGTVQYLENVTANQILTVTEPQYSYVGPQTPGSSTSIQTNLIEDVGLPYTIAVSSSVVGEYYLPDGRAIRVPITDPLIGITTTFGNPYLGFYAGVVPGSGVLAPLLTLPNFPGLSGFSLWVIGVTVDPTFLGGIKTILGPQRFPIL